MDGKVPASSRTVLELVGISNRPARPHVLAMPIDTSFNVEADPEDVVDDLSAFRARKSQKPLVADVDMIPPTTGKGKRGESGVDSEVPEEKIVD